VRGLRELSAWAVVELSGATNRAKIQFNRDPKRLPLTQPSPPSKLGGEGFSASSVARAKRREILNLILPLLLQLLLPRTNAQALNGHILQPEKPKSTPAVT
jgi:hypothetical protein